MFLIGNMNLSTSKDFGARLREKRKALGVTQKDLAMASGTGLRFIIDLEKGKPSCQIGKALAVAQALGLKFEAHDL
jgi:HTH-type transcriptional regulator/antitoxin HipB